MDFSYLLMSLLFIFLFLPCLATRFLGAALVKGRDDLKVHICKDFSIWLCNVSSETKTVGPMELFGFNVGNFKDVLAGPSVF